MYQKTKLFLILIVFSSFKLLLPCLISVRNDPVFKLRFLKFKPKFKNANPFSIKKIDRVNIHIFFNHNLLSAKN